MRRATLWGHVLFWALVAFACVEYIVPKWREFGLSTRMSELSLGWLAGGLVILAAQYLTIFLLWGALVRVLGGRPNASALYRAFALSLLPRYVPGKLLGPGLRIRLTARAGVPYPVAFASLVWEMSLALGGSAMIAALALPFGSPAKVVPTEHWVLAVALGLSILALVVLRMERVRRLVSTWIQPAIVLQHRWSLGFLLVGYAGSWFLYASAHWLLARAIVVSLPDRQFLPLLVALAASWAIGVLSIFAPAGIGVREGSLFLFARGLMDAPSALLFVSLSRLMMFGVEVLLTITGVLLPGGALPLSRGQPLSSGTDA